MKVVYRKKRLYQPFVGVAEKKKQGGNWDAAGAGQADV